MGSEVMVLSTEMRVVMKMVMLIMLSVMVVKIMTSLRAHWCVCLCWRDGPPAAPNCSADLLFLPRLCLCRSTWSRRGRCTWSSICPDRPLKVKKKKKNPPQHGCFYERKGQKSHMYIRTGKCGAVVQSGKYRNATCKADVNESGKVEVF